MFDFKILDCTLRDGGYYTNWDFEQNMVDSYLNSFNNLPVEYLEVGYRSVPLKGYLGEYFYCPHYVLERIKSLSNKKIVIILNEKDISASHVDELLTPCLGLVDMVRIAIDPKNLSRAITLAEAVKKMGFMVGFNVMYMSSWKENKEFLNQIHNVDGLADYFYMVDSYGGVYPKDVREIYELVKSELNTKIGFHGHNNLELALINTLEAINCGVDIVDATVTGMGRGAGNLKTELLLTTLNAQNDFNLDFNELSKSVDPFVDLQKTYNWGTNLPYMVSGANSLPQKEVMEWVTKRYYSLNSIIRALSNQSKGIKDNRNLDRLSLSDSEKNYDAAMIIGGGPSVKAHSKAILTFLSARKNIVVIHASSKNSKIFEGIDNDQFFCLVGNEGHRLEDVFDKSLKIDGKSILPPYPRKMGTYIPSALEGNSFELNEISFTDKYQGSHTSISLQAIVEMNLNNVFMVGYDGYIEDKIEKKEQELFLENEYQFNEINKLGVDLISLTPTDYKNIIEKSVYSYV